MDPNFILTHADSCLKGKKPRHKAGRLKLDHYITHRFKGVEGGDRGRSPEGGLRGGMPLGHHLETLRVKRFPWFWWRGFHLHPYEFGGFGLNWVTANKSPRKLLGWKAIRPPFWGPFGLFSHG